MTATLTARVLAWAADPDDAPPVGPLWDAAALTEPDPTAVAMLRSLTAATAARLGAGLPPFGDSQRVGSGALLLAVAIGVRRDPMALRILRLAPAVPIATEPWAECTARHAVVAAFLARPGGAKSELVEAALEASPLTMVLHRPPRSGSVAARAAAHRLRTRPAGADLLAATLAAPSDDPLVQAWRAELIARLQHDSPSVVVDAYLIARLWYGREWDRQVAAARRELLRTEKPTAVTVATLRFWLPLADLVRAEAQRRGLSVRVPSTRRQRNTVSLRELTFWDHTAYTPAIELSERYRAVLAVPPQGRGTSDTDTEEAG